MKTKPARSILVLDSGIGGMTVVRAIREHGPSLALTYIADNAYFPYGRLDTEALTGRIQSLVAQALDRHPFDAAVIACNTASTVVLDALRAEFTLPIVGVVPAVKTAGEISKSRIIGLLATEGTVRGRYLDGLIEQFAGDCRVERVGCPGLAALAEDKVRGRFLDTGTLRAALAPLQTPELAGLDVVVLGCTHYPILQAELAVEMHATVQWLDPSDSVARRLLQVLEGTANGRSDGEGRPESDTVFFTSTDGDPEDMRPFLAALGFQRLSYLPAESAAVS